MPSLVHPTALVDPRAELGADVEIGPYCIVGPRVRLGDGVRLLSQVSVSGSVSIGDGTVVHPFAALGGPPQDVSFKGEDTSLTIGRNVQIREHVTMHLGTVRAGGQTTVGDNGLFMVGSHVGHDCTVGDNTVFANNATLGGRVTVESFVNLGGLSAVHQLCRVGKYAFVGGGAPLTGDVIPFGMVDNHGRLHGLNLIGLKRRGFSREAINGLRGLYRDVFEGAGHFEDRLAGAVERYAGLPEAAMIFDFIRNGEKRALCLPARA
jgi:UDP-N-acetylglucosamine acyltransferase